SARVGVERAYGPCRRSVTARTVRSGRPASNPRCGDDEFGRALGGDGAARRTEDKGSALPLGAQHARGDARRRNRRSTGIVRDALLNLIVYQGDTEFASVEQQRNLLHHAPSDYDLLSLQRVMTEEMRHGWQMSYLLCSHFGDEGKREAAKLLERRADEGERLL